MISIVFALLLRAVDAPLEAAQREAANPIPVVVKATHSDPQAIEWLKKIDRTKGGDGSCYIEFEREIYDPVWKTRDIAQVRYFFIRGREGRLYLSGGQYPEALFWTPQEFANFHCKEERAEFRSLRKEEITPTLPNRWYIASLMIKPDIELIKNLADVSILKEDDSNVTIRITPTQPLQSFSFESLTDFFKRLHFCDPKLISHAGLVDVEINRVNSKVESIRLTESTKTIQTYRVKTLSTDRRGIEQSLESFPIKAPDGWQVDRYSQPAE